MKFRANIMMKGQQQLGQTNLKNYLSWSLLVWIRIMKITYRQNQQLPQKYKFFNNLFRMTSEEQIEARGPNLLVSLRILTRMNKMFWEASKRLISGHLHPANIPRWETSLTSEQVRKSKLLSSNLQTGLQSWSRNLNQCQQQLIAVW